MSVIVVVRKGREAVIAADTMSKGDGIKDTAEYIANHEKISKVGDSYIALSGPSSAKLALRHYANDQDSPLLLDSVERIYTAWLTLHHALTGGYFLNTQDDTESAFESTRMDAVIANPSGIYGVSAHRSVKEFTKFYAYGRGDELALGAMYVAYKLPGSTAEEIARLGIEAAAEFSDAVSLPMTYRCVQLKE